MSESNATPDPRDAPPADAGPSRRGALIFVTALVAVAAVAVVVVLLTSGDDDSSGGESASATECETVEEPPAKDVDLPGPEAEEPSAERVVFDTSCGQFTVTLDAERAPKTAASFQYLAEEGVFDDTIFHRVAPGFVIQGGDPAGDGTGGPGYSVREAPPQSITYERGLVAMAKTGAEPPGTSGSQFFVVTAEADAGLPPDFAIAGEVTEGFETIERIEALGGGPGTDGAPTQPVLIINATVE